MGDVVSIGKNKKKVRQPLIITFLHCALCYEDIPDGISMQDYALEEVGFTKVGLQVWCRRHECNIMHVDFEKMTHPAIEGNDG